LHFAVFAHFLMFAQHLGYIVADSSCFLLLPSLSL
jgi:hypothetical protein